MTATTSTGRNADVPTRWPIVVGALCAAVVTLLGRSLISDGFTSPRQAPITVLVRNTPVPPTAGYDNHQTDTHTDRVNGVKKAPSGPDETTVVATRTAAAIIRDSRVERSAAGVASTSSSVDTSELLMPREWRRDWGALLPTGDMCPTGSRFEVCTWCVDWWLVSTPPLINSTQ